MNSKSRVVEDAVLELIELVLVEAEGGQSDENVLAFLGLDDLEDGGDHDDSGEYYIYTLYICIPLRKQPSDIKTWGHMFIDCI